MRAALLFALSVMAVPALADEIPEPETVHLYHVNLRERLDGFHIITANPQDPLIQYIAPESRKVLDHFFRDWRTQKQTHMAERTLWNLYLLGKFFHSPIEVTSSYRSGDRSTSPHLAGRAIDLGVVGQAHEHVWTTLKQLDNVGLGYYPHCDFLHMDSRPKNYYWIDDSYPGRPEKYRKDVSQKQPIKRRHPKAKASFNNEAIHQQIRDFLLKLPEKKESEWRGLQCPKPPIPNPLSSNEGDGFSVLTQWASLVRAVTTDPTFYTNAEKAWKREMALKAEREKGHLTPYRIKGGVDRFEPSGGIVKDDRFYVPTDRGGMVMVYQLPLSIGVNAPIETLYTPEELNTKDTKVKFEAVVLGQNNELWALETYRRHVWSLEPAMAQPIEGSHFELLEESIDHDVSFLGLEAMAYDGQKLWIGTRHYADYVDSPYIPYFVLTDGERTYFNGQGLVYEDQPYTLSDMTFVEDYLWQTWSLELPGDSKEDVRGLLVRSKMSKDGVPGELEICRVFEMGKPEGIAFYNGGFLIVYDNDKDRKGEKSDQFPLTLDEDYVDFIPATCDPPSAL